MSTFTLSTLVHFADNTSVLSLCNILNSGLLLVMEYFQTMYYYVH